ncbi:MAG: sigma 54-interacting transcriptional regulator [Proteobacteria bacterium]|nr:sigma 54-interacting transcriptional regulator [Pseudomonadota bacterium]
MKVLTHTDRPAVESFHGLVAVSPEMRELFRLIQRVAKSDISLLIRGETGTGKELVARAMHALSGRSNGPYRAVNCATLTGELLASELFGHVRGAFTGAVADRKGVFSLANKGTLFLDEVAEIPLEIQPRLLRVLQSGEFIPVGATKAEHVDVRIVSATHRALRREVANGRFRADLMYRIRVRPLYIPPLRDRTGDIEALTWHFIDLFNGENRRVGAIEESAMQALTTYRWPGNVRELRNVIEGAFAFGEGSVLTMDELTPELRGEEPPEDGVPLYETLEDRERATILAALTTAGGRRGEAAAALGMSRTTLWRKLRELGL